ncbi:MAG: dual specificity protein phosphatase family protein [Mycobacterium sp.]
MTDPTRVEMASDPTTRRFSGVAIHGNTPFDTSFISHIEGNLWQGGCEDGLVLPKNIKHVVSLYPWERYTIKHEVDTELYVRMYDAVGPVDTDQIWDLAQWVTDCVHDGPTLVHCQAGLNRSSLLAAAALYRLSNYRLYNQHRKPSEIVELLREKRSPAVLCNPSFLNWVLEIGS